jgi:hypothetical protein
MLFNFVFPNTINDEHVVALVILDGPDTFNNADTDVILL